MPLPTNTVGKHEDDEEDAKGAGQVVGLLLPRIFLLQVFYHPHLSSPPSSLSSFKFSSSNLVCPHHHPAPHCLSHPFKTLIPITLLILLIILMITTTPRRAAWWSTSSLRNLCLLLLAAPPALINTVGPPSYCHVAAMIMILDQFLPTHLIVHI